MLIPTLPRPLLLDIASTVGYCYLFAHVAVGYTSAVPLTGRLTLSQSLLASLLLGQITFDPQVDFFDPPLPDPSPSRSRDRLNITAFGTILNVEISYALFPARRTAIGLSYALFHHFAGPGRNHYPFTSSAGLVFKHALTHREQKHQ